MLDEVNALLVSEAGHHGDNGHVQMAQTKAVPESPGQQRILSGYTAKSVVDPSVKVRCQMLQPQPVCTGKEENRCPLNLHIRAARELRGKRTLLTVDSLRGPRLRHVGVFELMLQCIWRCVLAGSRS
eukprot:scaffold77036_cov33-Prasinocladus_malaysianus.AAC.1